jgi:hypothetical protein
MPAGDTFLYRASTAKMAPTMERPEKRKRKEDQDRVRLNK